MVAKQQRQIQPYSREVRQLFGLPTYKDKPFSGKKDDAHVSVYDTLKEIEFIAKNRSYQTEKLANYLRANNLENTLSNIFDFLYTHVQYVQDSDTAEQVRTPLRLLADQQGDCDCYTAFIACVLTNLGVPFYLKMTDYGMTDDFGQAVGYQHVYIAVPQQGRKDYIIDVVLDNFNQEAAGIHKAYYYPMNGAAPRETEQPKASSVNGLNGSRGLGCEAMCVTGIVMGVAQLGNMFFSSYNAKIDAEHALERNSQSLARQEITMPDINKRYAEGEVALIQEELSALRKGYGLGGIWLKDHPQGSWQAVLDAPSYFEAKKLAFKALDFWLRNFDQQNNQYNSCQQVIILRDWIAYLQKQQDKIRQEFLTMAVEQGVINEYEKFMLLTPDAGTTYALHTEGRCAEGTIMQKIPARDANKMADLRVKALMAAQAQSKGSNVKGESANTGTNNTSPKSEEGFFSKHWKTPTGKAAIIGGGVVGSLLLIGLVKAII